MKDNDEFTNVLLTALLIVLFLSLGCVMNMGGSLAISNRSNTDVAVADTDGKACLKQEGSNSLEAAKTTETATAVNTSSGKAKTGDSK